jgi:hypothetical protein
MDLTYDEYVAAYEAGDFDGDPALDAYEELVQDALVPLVEPVMLAVEATEDFDGPRPWTWERHLLSLWLDNEIGEDGVRELLQDHFREEAERIVQETEPSGPCCNDFACPCGNTNNYPG